MVGLHQHERHFGFGRVASFEGLGNRPARHIAGLEQMPGDGGDNHIRLIAVREHRIHPGDSLDLARRVAHISQRPDQGLRAQFGGFGLDMPAQILAGLDEGPALAQGFQAPPQFAEKCRIMGVGHGHHPHPRHLEHPLGVLVPLGAAAGGEVLGQRMDGRNGVGAQALDAGHGIPSWLVAFEC